LVEARLWSSAAPWLESVRSARPYWLIRSLSFVPIAGGFLALFAGLIVGQRRARAEGPPESAAITPQPLAEHLSQAASEAS
ncbi:MAG TPA: hypothetical protein VF146_16450, partial [Bryobacteraceae bacterium]